MTRRAFTLIELLIVVAIIAILAAIALPNFLEAQTRARVSRSLSDLRSVATALEAYAVDASKYPPHGEQLTDGTIFSPARQAGLGTREFVPGRPLTTPVAYLSRLPRDVFLSEATDDVEGGYGYIQTRLMREILLGKGFVGSAEGIEPRYGLWRLYAAGPDGDTAADAKTSVLYDPTNGTISNGDLVRSQRSPRETLSQDEG